jgi:hypothetical protein
MFVWGEPGCPTLVPRFWRDRVGILTLIAMLRREFSPGWEGNSRTGPRPPPTVAMPNSRSIVDLGFRFPTWRWIRRIRRIGSRPGRQVPRDCKIVLAPPVAFQEILAVYKTFLIGARNAPFRKCTTQNSGSFDRGWEPKVGIPPLPSQPSVTPLTGHDPSRC